MNLLREIYELLQSEIEYKRSNPKKQDNNILSLMLSVRDEENKPTNDDQLKDELMTDERKFFFLCNYF